MVGDCENHCESVTASLRFAGLLNKKGGFKAKARDAHIVQTGDLLSKHGPDPAVVRFWEELRGAAHAAGCSLHLVAGNHELEIWRRLQTGERLGLTRREQRAMKELIRSMNLFHVAGSMLFIHGYPTVSLLRHIRTFLEGAGNRINDYNLECFRPALDNTDRLGQYAYLRNNSRQAVLLHDVPTPERYYRRHGREVADLLGSLGIDLVVHGHRPERSGVQQDYELERWLPGIRMISNDVQLRQQGLGATVIKQADSRPPEVCFFNGPNATSGHRAAAKALLRAPAQPSSGQPSYPEQVMLGGQIYDFLRKRDSSASDFLPSGARVER